MMNNVSFTGLRNIGACSFAYNYEKGKRIGTALLVNLIDDNKGKDFSEYKDVMRKCSESFEHYFPEDKNFLHVQTIKYFPDDEDFETVPQLVVNGYVVPTENKTMPLFSYIAKLTKRVLASSEKDIKISNDFKYGPDGDSYLTGMRVSDNVENPEQKRLLLDSFYSLPEAKKAAKSINDAIQAQMIDYFA